MFLVLSGPFNLVGKFYSFENMYQGYINIYSFLSPLRIILTFV